MNPTLRRNFRRIWHDWLRPLLLAAAIVFPLKSSLAEWNYVPSGSMIPSLLPGDFVWVDKLAYDLKVPFTTWHLATWANPRRGDVAVFYSPADGIRLVKRVVGLPGDVIESRQDRLWVNGRPVAYVPAPAALARTAPRGAFFAEEQLTDRGHPVTVQPRRPARRTFGPVRVPAACYFMMGDNRDDSFDSRYFGCVPRRNIVGRATEIVVSVDPTRYYRPRPDRLWRPVP